MHPFSPAAASARSPLVPRPVRAMFLTLLLLAVALLAPSAAHAEAPRSVTVRDTTASVDRAALEAELSGVDFRTPVDLVVLVLDVTDHGASPSDDLALNDAVLDHARTTDPSMLSPDGVFFADGTVIIALDPDNRFVGTYAGEDVKLDDGEFTAVQDAMKDDARDRDWEAALLAGAEKYADLLLRPWWQKPAALVTAAVGIAAALGAALTMLGLRDVARRRVDDALPRLQGVLASRELTDTAASTLPEASPYAQAVLRDHLEYRAKVAEATRLSEELPAPEDRPWSWGFTSWQRQQARELESTVSFLDDTDDDIVSAADLLHRIGDWRTGWERELTPLRDSVATVDEVLEELSEMSTPERAAAKELEAVSCAASEEMDTLTAQLEEDRITPEAALARLDALTEELSAAATLLQRHRIERLAEDETEQMLLREVEVEDSTVYRSVRASRLRWDRRSGTSDAFRAMSPVLWLNTWQHSAGSALETHRAPSSSGGGSFSGYSGGGGFSGAGSSSRF